MFQTRFFHGLVVLQLAFVCFASTALAAGGRDRIGHNPSENGSPTDTQLPAPPQFVLGPGYHPGSNQPDVYAIAVGTENPVTRTYRVYAPMNYNRAAATPVVLAFHGGGADGYRMQQASRLNQTADSAGFLVVYPDAIVSGKSTSPTWNADDDSLAGIPAGSFHLMPSQPAADDVGFVRALIEDLNSRFNIDPTRIYATGFSNGAQMVYRLACEASDIIAAVAPVGASGLVGAEWDNGYIVLNPANCAATRAIPILHIQGANDWCVLPDENSCGGCLTTMDILAKQIYPSDRYFSYRNASKRQQIRDEVKSTVVPLLSDHTLAVPADFSNTLGAKFFSPNSTIQDQIDFFRGKISISRTICQPLSTSRYTLTAGTPHAQSWANAQDCQSVSAVTPTSIGSLSGERKVYSQCKNGSRVEMVLLRGLGHTWPGGSSEDFAMCATTDSNQLELCDLYVRSIMGDVRSDADVNSRIWNFFLGI